MTASKAIGIPEDDDRGPRRLHEVYGLAVPGPAPRRMTAYAVAWGERRNAVLAPAGLVLTAGSRLRRRLSRRVAARAGRSAFSLAPLLVGATFGAVFNRRETLTLGRAVRASLVAEPGARRAWDCRRAGRRHA